MNNPEDTFKGIYKEYRDIEKERHPVEFVETANSLSNAPKNRYADVLPIKHSAVKLSLLKGVEDSDYINANFVYDSVSGDLDKGQLYITCQAPLVTTFPDFWRMIWEQSVPVIVMITNLIEKNRVKADPYWPAHLCKSEKYGDTFVKLAEETQLSPGIIMRKFRIWKAQPVKTRRDSQSGDSSGETGGLLGVSKSGANSLESYSEGYLKNSYPGRTKSSCTNKNSIDIPSEANASPSLATRLLTKSTSSSCQSFDKLLSSSPSKSLQEYKRRTSLSGSSAYDKHYFTALVEERRKELANSGPNMTSSRNIVKEVPKEQEQPIEELELADENDMNYSFSYSSEEEIKEDFEEFGEVREVIQLHCTNWPDFGVPESTKEMVHLIEEMDKHKKSLKEPIVVHCSAGIGRTGTFVAIHMCLYRSKLGLEYNIKDIIKHLRTQRIGMVQSKEQYSFVYAVTKDMLQLKESNTPSNGKGKVIYSK